MQKLCDAVRKDGQSCRAPATMPDGRCFAHSTQNAEQRAEARAAGGRGKSAEQRTQRLLPEVMRPVLSSLIDGMVKVRAGQMDPKIGTCLASMASAICRVYEIGLGEQRLRELEERLGAGDDYAS